MSRFVLLGFGLLSVMTLASNGECSHVLASMRHLAKSGCDLSSICTGYPDAPPPSLGPPSAPASSPPPAKQAERTDENACWQVEWWSNSCNDQCHTKLSPTTEAACQCSSSHTCKWGTQRGCREAVKGSFCLTGPGGGTSESGCTADVKCPENTLAPTFLGSRPAFRGPNCYDPQYGGRFGPQWTPSGRTVVEKVFPSATSLYKAVQITPKAETPRLAAWDTHQSGCSAATAIWENWICAVEYLMEEDLTFDLGAKMEDFGNTGDVAIDLIEVVAFISNNFKETASLSAWEEPGTGYRDETNTDWPAQPGASYHGRGPVQLSWNYNYGPFSEWIFGDKMTLLSEPDIVDSEGPMGFIAAFWFWFTRRDFVSGMPIQGTMRTRDAIVHWTDGGLEDIYDDPKYDQYSGLALSTNVINGGIECNKASENTPDAALWRVIYFLHVAARVGLLDQLEEWEYVIPKSDNRNACAADDFCSGFFRGCTAAQGGMDCEPFENACGPTYVLGWNEHVCNF